MEKKAASDLKVKICGLTSAEDALKAGTYGADLLGFIFIRGTQRCVNDPSDVKIIMAGIPEELRTRVGRVGLFHNDIPERIARIVSDCGFNYVQLQGEETPHDCRTIKKILREKYGSEVMIIKAFKVKEDILPCGSYTAGDYDDADYFVFDTFHPRLQGGTGTRFDWDVLVKAKGGLTKPFFIAGGLTPQNVADAVIAVGPYGVDVSSGVEKIPGKKDEDLLKEFIKNAKNAQSA
ncbi:MAG: phosphoribosylanthranilate isomerase [Candidatus Omnitrophota bacterium]